MKTVIKALVIASLISTPILAQSPITVLITAGVESDTVGGANGAATRIGGVVLGTAGYNSSSYEHSEVWEVFRKFSTECPNVVFVTNPGTPHTLTVHTDYEKFHNAFFGDVRLYQLSLLDAAGNPLYVSRKELLRHQIKPICKIIKQ